DAGVLHGHLPAREGHHARPRFDVAFVEGGSAQGGAHGRDNSRSTAPRVGPREPLETRVSRGGSSGRRSRSPPHADADRSSGRGTPTSPSPTWASAALRARPH